MPKRRNAGKGGGLSRFSRLFIKNVGCRCRFSQLYFLCFPASHQRVFQRRAARFMPGQGGKQRRFLGFQCRLPGFTPYGHIFHLAFFPAQLFPCLPDRFAASYERGSKRVQKSPARFARGRALGLPNNNGRGCSLSEPEREPERAYFVWFLTQPNRLLESRVRRPLAQVWGRGALSVPFLWLLSPLAI